MNLTMRRPTKIFYNATFITLDPAQPTAEALAIAGDQIYAVGSTKDMLSLASQNTKLVDLADQTIVPGFNDSHMHLLNLGQSKDGVDLMTAGSVPELVHLGQEFVRNNPDREWILGRGWNDERFSNKTLPTKADLDQISSANPVVFTRVCGHVCVVNSRALQKAGITANTKDPHGGRIERDSTGEPSGILHENAIDLVKSLIPTPTVTDLKRFLKKATQIAASLGLTTVQSNDLHGTATLTARLKAYHQLVKEGELPIRVNLQVTMTTPDDLLTYLEIRDSYPDLGTHLSLGPLKLYADGSLGGRTAALSHPYADAPNTSGITLYSQDELDELVFIAAKANLQVAIHAIGDGAIDMVMNSYEEAKNSVPNWTCRPRIVHCQITRFDQLARMSRLGIVADIQPIFLPTDLHFVEQRVGAENAKYSYAWKTLREQGVHTAGGSDCPVEPSNPLWGMHAAITRQDREGNPSGGWHPQECLSPLEALSLFTIDSAYANHEENIKGSLSTGKLADFVVLPADPTQVAYEQLLTMQVKATYVGGKLVFAQP